MRRGPKPKPLHEKIATGNPGKQKLPPLDKTITRGISKKAPEYLQLSVEAQKIWQNIIDDLSILGMFSKLDEWGFARYCTLYSYWRACTRPLDETGELVVETVSPHVTMERASPHITLALKLDTALRNFEAQYGMNPADRQRMQLAAINSGAEKDLLTEMDTDRQAPEAINIGELNPDRLKAKYGNNLN